MSSNEKIIALVSVGLHPKSGRARRADQDARAVELGLSLSGNALEMLHVGNADNADNDALRSYLGMGLEEMTVLEQGAGSSLSETLGDYVKTKMPDIVLSGVRAESGDSSGMTPYQLAEQLQWPMVSSIADIVKIEGGEAEVLQALPRGQRRILKVALPFIASVDGAAAGPRQSAFGPASRGSMCTIAASVQEQAEPSHDAALDVQRAPARKRAKRMKIAKAKTAADRFKAATVKSQASGGQVIKDKPAREQAQAILSLLLEEGVVR